VRSFLVSFGVACPPLMLYCGMRVIDERIRECVDGLLESAVDSAASDAATAAEVSDSGTISTRARSARTHSSVSALDFLEQSPRLCRMLEAILHRSVGAHSNSSGSSSTVSSSSASLRVCSAGLASFGIDWRTVWRVRLMPLLTAQSLALHHPMLCKHLWRMQAAMDAPTQIALAHTLPSE
jgi:hypothetical protein